MSLLDDDGVLFREQSKNALIEYCNSLSGIDKACNMVAWYYIIEEYHQEFQITKQYVKLATLLGIYKECKPLRSVIITDGEIVGTIQDESMFGYFQSNVQYVIGRLLAYDYFDYLDMKYGEFFSILTQSVTCLYYHFNIFHEILTNRDIFLKAPYDEMVRKMKNDMKCLLNECVPQ